MEDDLKHISDNDNTVLMDRRASAAPQFRRDGTDLLSLMTEHRSICRMNPQIAHQTWLNLGKALEDEFCIPLPYDSELLSALAKDAQLAFGSLLSMAREGEHVPLHQIAALFQLIHRASSG